VKFYHAWLILDAIPIILGAVCTALPFTTPTALAQYSARVSSKRWSTGRQHSFVALHQQGVRLTLWLQVIYEIDGFV
jgi:hypothetical protein